MRTMLKVTVPVEQGNRAIVEGTLPRVIQDTIERIKPEATYFTVENGKRTAFFFFDMTDASQMPQIGEPLFMTLGAELELTPVMTAQDLQKGLADLPAARR
jgi:hypothetical protein